VADRLYVVVETAQAYAGWLRSRGLSSYDPRLVPLYPLNHERKLRRASRGIAYMKVWRAPARSDRSRPILDMLDARDAFLLVGKEIDQWLASHPGPDELVGLALLAMLRDKTGLSGTVDYVGEGWDRREEQSARWSHLEDCAEASIAGPVACTEDATSTGSGFEILTVPISCPHGEPITAKTAGYGHGHLLPKMFELGEHLAEVRECEREEGDDA
jgi:hypothetical protein